MKSKYQVIFIQYFWRIIETIFSGIFTLQFPEFEIADHDVKRVEGTKSPGIPSLKPPLIKYAEEAGSRSEQKITKWLMELTWTPCSNMKPASKLE